MSTTPGPPEAPTGAAATGAEPSGAAAIGLAVLGTVAVAAAPQLIVDLAGAEAPGWLSWAQLAGMAAGWRSRLS